MRSFRLFETSSQISYRHPTATNYPRCPRSDFDAVPRVVHSIPNSPRGLIAGWSPAIHMVTDVYVESSVARIPATGALSSLNSVPNRHSIHYNSLITPGEFISPWESHYGTRLLCGCGSASVSSSCQLMLLSRIYPPHGLGEGTGIYKILYATISCSSLLQWRIRAWEQEGRARCQVSCGVSVSAGPPRSHGLPEDVQHLVDQIYNHCSKIHVAKVRLFPSFIFSMLTAPSTPSSKQAGTSRLTGLCNDLTKHYEDIRRLVYRSS